MVYSTPPIQTLLDQAATDISSSALAGADGFLPRSILNLLGMVQAGLAFGHYDQIAYAARQATPFYATDEFLEGWAALKKVFRKDATASGADGNSYATFSGAVGTPLLAATPIQRGDGFAYTVLAEGAVGGGGTVTVPIVATLPGSLGNCPAGTVLTLASGVTNIASNGSASTPITAGTEQETDDALRLRMLFAYGNPPSAGNLTDYEAWAEAVPGVTRAWTVANGMGPGTVVIYTMFDDAESADGGFPQGSNGVASAETRDTPATGDQLAVANAIFPLRPVTALVYSCAPVAAPINYSITELSPNTSAIQAGIATALAAMHLRKASPAGTLWPSDWNEAIAAVPGIQHFDVASPSAAVTASAGNLSTVGTIGYAS
jgi:uncharacterized phage protein gp47/JayE